MNHEISIIVLEVINYKAKHDYQIGPINRNLQTKISQFNQINNQSDLTFQFERGFYIGNCFNPSKARIWP